MSSQPKNKLLIALKKLSDKIKSENEKGDLKDLKKINECENKIASIKTKVRLIFKQENEILEIVNSMYVEVGIPKTIEDYEKEIDVPKTIEDCKKEILSFEDEDSPFFIEDNNDKEVREITEKRIEQLSKAIRILRLKDSIHELKKQIANIISRIDIDIDSGKRKSKTKKKSARSKKQKSSRSKKQNRKKKSKINRFSHYIYL